MTDILLPYGLRNGSLVHINSPDILSGITDCTCPECGETLVAKKGPEKQHHFAHKGDAGRPLDSRCFGGLETAAHLRAKEIIAEAGEIRFPDRRIIKLDSVMLERKLDPHAIRPDITVSFDGVVGIIEIFVTSAVSDAKRGLLQQRLIPSMEINLQRWRRELPDDQAYRDAVLYHAARRWIYDSAGKDRRAAHVVLEDARREAAARAEFLASLPDAHAERIRAHSERSPTTPQVSLWAPPEQSDAAPDRQKKQPDPKFLSPEERAAWIEKIMEPVRRRYAEVIQPQVCAAAEARRRFSNTAR